LELQPRRRKRGKLIDSVHKVVEAVVAGRFEERLREVDGKVIGAKSTLEPPGAPRIVCRYSNLGSKAVFRGERRTVRYSPYA